MLKIFRNDVDSSLLVGILLGYLILKLCTAHFKYLLEGTEIKIFCIDNDNKSF
jgi:hypothetical protein